MIKAAVNIHVFFLWDNKELEVELLGIRNGIVYLTLCEITKFSKVVVPFYTTDSSVWEFQLL